MVAGPPPMRITAKKTNDLSIIALEKLRAKDASNLVAAVAMPVPAPTRAAGKPVAETNSTDVTLLTLPEAAPDQTFGPTVFNLAEQGGSIVTPQMLATYFRPVTIGTNSGVIGGVLPIGFVPPFTVPHPDSRAEYLVK